MGMLGQDHVCDENTVWITKTHYPLKMKDKSFKAQKMFCIVRNPIDVFPSYASLRLLTSHSLELNEKLNEKFPEWWEQFVRVNSQRMAKSSEEVMMSISKKIPTLILRYEDLVLNPEKELTDLLCFLLEVFEIIMFYV